MSNEDFGVLITIVLVMLAAVFSGLNTDVTITPNDMSRANVVCLNSGGLTQLGHDNGGDYTAYCNNGSSYTYQIQEKAQ